MSKSSAAKFIAIPEALKKSIQATRVEYRQLGKSGLRVSNPILGGLQIGSSAWFPWVLNEDEVSFRVTMRSRSSVNRVVHCCID